MSYIDRAVYFHSIDTGNLDYTTAIMNYFDQLMSIYGLLQPCTYTVKILPSNDNSLILELDFNSDLSSRILSIVQNDNRFSLYGRSFNIGILNSTATNIQLIIITD